MAEGFFKESLQSAAPPASAAQVAADMGEDKENALFGIASWKGAQGVLNQKKHSDPRRGAQRQVLGDLQPEQYAGRKPLLSERNFKSSNSRPLGGSSQPSQRRALRAVNMR
eukprot:m.28610 g.28610  ORF g.28610 m.28610 type:complete len:111 (-) comp4975_c0_seq1:461-793(-)